jgi:hypothetical protein
MKNTKLILIFLRFCRTLCQKHSWSACKIILLEDIFSRWNIMIVYIL